MPERKLGLDRHRRTEAAHAAEGAARQFDGKSFFDAGTVVRHSTIAIRSRSSAWIKPEAATGAIVSRGEDYVEGQQHGLYLMDGKLRLHVTFRWTDLAMRVETVNRCR